MTRLAVSGVAATAVTATLAACGSSTDGSAASGLGAAMSSISATEHTREYVEFGDLARMRDLHIVSPVAQGNGGYGTGDQRWGRVGGYGTGSLAPFAVPLRRTVGLDLYTADTAITAGQPPHQVVRLDGTVPSTAITSELEGIGAKPRTFAGTGGLSLAPDDKIDLTGPLGRYGLVNGVNQVVVDDHRFVASPDGAGIAAGLGGGTSLADTEPYAAIADCLGDSLAAIVFTPDGGDARVVGVGVLDPGRLSDPAHDVLCVAPADGSQDTVHQTLVHDLGPTGVDERTHAPLTQYVARTAVTDDGDLVRADLTLRDSAPVDYLVQAAVTGEQQFWTS